MERYTAPKFASVSNFLQVLFIVVVPKIRLASLNTYHHCTLRQQQLVALITLIVVMTNLLTTNKRVMRHDCHSLAPDGAVIKRA